MSALPPKADMVRHNRDVRFVPKADIGSTHHSRVLSRTIGVLTDFAVNVAAQDDPRPGACVNGILDDHGTVDDDGRSRATWIAMRLGISGLVPKILWIKDRDVDAVALLQ